MQRDEARRIRACYDEFLACVGEQQDLWAIALMDYYRLPIEWWRAEPDAEQDWQQPVPACFADLWASGEIARLVRRKEEIQPSSDFCSVPRNLELEYDWHQAAGVYPGCPQRTMPFAAAKLLLEYYRLVADYGDDAGDAAWRYLFDETSDVEMLVAIAKHGARTPLQELELLLALYEIWRGVEMKPSHQDWLHEELRNWLGWLLDDGAVCWALYQYLQENDGRLAIWDDEMTSLELLQTSARAGVLPAQLELGWQYVSDCREGVGQEKWTLLLPAAEAVHWLEQALPHDSLAGLLLAEIYRWGYGVQPSEERVAHYCRRTADTHYEGQAAAHQEPCITRLAERYAAGVGVPQDRAEAARLYRRTERAESVDWATKRPDLFLFHYCADGADQPRDPRAAVHWWLRSERSVGVRFTRYGLRDAATADRPETVRWLNDPEPAFADGEERYAYTRRRETLYDWLERGSYLEEDPLRELQDRERVRLLYDAAQTGDARCAALLQALTAAGVALAEWLTQLVPDDRGVYDWPDAWYEEALARIEAELARQAAVQQREQERMALYQEAADELDLLTPEEWEERLLESARRDKERRAQEDAEWHASLDWLMSLSDEERQRAFDEAVSPEPSDWWNGLTPAQQERIFNAMDLDAELEELAGLDAPPEPQ